MARIRSVKPELRTSEVVASWPFEVRYFFVLLWGYLDDRGRGLDVPKTIAGDCFPHDQKVTGVTVDRWLKLMSKPIVGSDATRTGPEDGHDEVTSTPIVKSPPICRYTVNGRRYLHCVNWREHQRPNRPSPSRLPACPVHEKLTEPLTEPGSEPLTEASLSDSLTGAAEQGSRGAEEQQRPRGEPPHGDRQAAAAARVILDNTDATPDEANALAAHIIREKRPRNAAGLIAALAKGPDLKEMLEDQRTRAGRHGIAAEIEAARKGPPCEHGEKGGEYLHPATQKPLCPLCRKKAEKP